MLQKRSTRTRPTTAAMPPSESSLVVLVHGYEGSGEGHWQHWLRAALEAAGERVAFPELPDPTEPDRDAWVQALAATVAAGEGASITFVAHSLGCWAVDHFLAQFGATGVHAALLVAPPSPYSLFEPILGFLPPPRSVSAWAPIAARTLVVGSDDDPHASDDEFEDLAVAIGARHQILPGAGHLNAASGFGPFPAAMAWLREVGAIAL